MYGTHTLTYTVLDIRKTFEGCEADLRTIARRTGKWTMEKVDNIFHDVLKLAEAKYLQSVSIVLKDINGNTLRATKFTVNDNGTASSSDRAGGNDWENIPNTSLSIILAYTQAWQNLGEAGQNKFEADNCKSSWSPTNIDLSFPHLTKSNAQLYGSNGYEVQKTSYK